MIEQDWRKYWYVRECCRLGALCAAHMTVHRAACGWPAKTCDVCDENEKRAGTPTGENEA